MKVLYVGSLSETACSKFYLKALKDLGHKVVAFDPKAFETTSVVDRWTIRLTKKPKAKKVNRIGEGLLKLCQEESFDIVFVIAENFLPDVFDVIRSFRKPVPKFLYHSHDNNFSKGILKPGDFFKSLAKYDILFTTKSQNVNRYKALGCSNTYFIPSAYEPSYHRPIPSERSRYLQKPIDISFVGTYDSSRIKFLKVIGWEKLYVWGNGWKRYRGFHQNRTHITPHAIYLDEYADVVSHSKLSLGLLREEAEDLHTQRTFEIPACGSFQIAPRNDEISTFFSEGKEIVCFSSLEEFKDKVEYYLKHESERSQIARAGYERVLKGAHTYRDRVREMLEKTVRKGA